MASFSEASAGTPIRAQEPASLSAFAFDFPVDTPSTDIVPQRYSDEVLTSAQAVPTTTFAPVNDLVLNQISSYVTLGVGRLQSAPKGKVLSSLLFKWSTWLSRMNDWLKENPKYPSLLLLPPVQLPRNLTFLPGAGPEALFAQSWTASLAPLPSEEVNILVNAVVKGAEACDKTFDQTSRDIVNFKKFIMDVNKIAAHVAVLYKRVSSPIVTQKTTASTSSYKVAAPSETTVQELGKSVLLVPSSTGKELVLQSDPLVVKTYGNFTNNVSQEPVKSAVDKTTSILQRVYAKLQEVTKDIPVWAWICILMLVMYAYVNKEKYSGETASNTVPSFASMTGGGSKHAYKSIVDFRT